MTRDPNDPRCPICGSLAAAAGSKRGAWRPQLYRFAHCETCGFTFVTNPSTDFAAIYDEAYYRGQGADPMVDYVAEMLDGGTIRNLEWEGIAQSVSGFVNLKPGTRWLDYGCGMGGLVAALVKNGIDAEGYEDGVPSGCESLSYRKRIDRGELRARDEAYDVVSAIEVLEHVMDPLEVLSDVRRVLKPGGLFFYTTGNAEKFKTSFLSWGYVRPEIHISYYEPRTVAYAFSRVGLVPVAARLDAGFTKIIAYKVLKELRRSRLAPWMHALPWRLIAHAVDARYGVTAFPLARKPASGE